jgi:hypothetical protein
MNNKGINSDLNEDVYTDLLQKNSMALNVLNNLSSRNVTSRALKTLDQIRD